MCCMLASLWGSHDLCSSLWTNTIICGTRWETGLGKAQLQKETNVNLICNQCSYQCQRGNKNITISRNLLDRETCTATSFSMIHGNTHFLCNYSHLKKDITIETKLNFKKKKSAKENRVELQQYSPRSSPSWCFPIFREMREIKTL